MPDTERVEPMGTAPATVNTAGAVLPNTPRKLEELRTVIGAPALMSCAEAAGEAPLNVTGKEPATVTVPAQFRPLIVMGPAVVSKFTVPAVDGPAAATHDQSTVTQLSAT